MLLCKTRSISKWPVSSIQVSVPAITEQPFHWGTGRYSSSIFEKDLFHSRILLQGFQSAIVIIVIIVDKVRCIRDNMASALQQSSPRVFAARPHTGLKLSDFQPVTVDEVRKLLASIPRKTSPLDVLSVSLY